MTVRGAWIYVTKLLIENYNWILCEKLNKTIIFCDDKNAPGQKFSNKFICADYSDDKAINQFAEVSDIITFEFENIPYETLNKLNKIKSVLPQTSINKIIQNRLFEKKFHK